MLENVSWVRATLGSGEVEPRGGVVRVISDEDKERVRQATDFVQLVAETVELRQRGQDFWGCCPFHGEKTPSFKVNPSTGLWHCFGCGEGGDVFSYVQRRENLEFTDAVRYLADRAGIELSEERASRGPRRSRLMEALEEAESFYHLMLMRGRGSDSAAARSYFAGRGFGSDVCRRWRLGYARGTGRWLPTCARRASRPPSWSPPTWRRSARGGSRTASGAA